MIREDLWPNHSIDSYSEINRYLGTMTLPAAVCSGDSGEMKKSTLTIWKLLLRR